MKVFEQDGTDIEVPMSYDEFWELVDRIGWPVERETVKLTPREKKLGGVYARKFREILQGVLQAKSFLEEDDLSCTWMHMPGGDDDFWDLCAHIVGLGKDVYKSVLEHPESVREYIDEAKENFEYLFNEGYERD